MKFKYACMLAVLCCLFALACGKKGESLTADEARSIAREAYIYAFPMVDGYRIMHAYYMAPGTPEYKAPMNQLASMARVYTPEDRAVQTPNSDTPYSFVGADLRAEPLVLTVPEIEKDRYYSIQLVDAYTHNFAYIGSRATGNEAGNFLLAGPDWKGETPSGVKAVIRSETNLVLGIYRTQLFDAADLEKVKAIQAEYKVQLLSDFLGTPGPAAAPALDYPAPLTPDAERTSLDVFSILNFLLTSFCPTVPSEVQLMERFAKIGVGPGQTFNIAKLSPEMKEALSGGITDAWTEFDTFKKTKLDTGETTSGDMFGTREFLKNNYLYRMAAAIMGIYGNSGMEAMYPIYTMDADGAKLDASSNRYTVRFAPGQLPPVNAFWSLTMYDLPGQFLVANPLNRYLLNSPMLPNLKKDADGGLTLYIQSDSPGKDREANWLPAPKAPFMMAMRLYWPKEEALNGTWTPPKAMRVQ